MTVKEIIESIDFNLSCGSDKIPTTQEDLILIKSALEKQIPKKPMTYNKYERMCECGAIVKTYQKHCKDCGQALDWSDVNDR